MLDECIYYILNCRQPQGLFVSSLTVFMSSLCCIVCSMLIGNGFVWYLLPCTRCFVWCLVTVTLCCSFCLQDIVENEDIKLDMMFMASLVHDLIKVGKLKQKDAVSKVLFAVINIKAVFFFRCVKHVITCEEWAIWWKMHFLDMIQADLRRIYCGYLSSDASFYIVRLAGPQNL